MIYKEFTSKGGVRTDNEDSFALYTKETNSAVRNLELGEVFIVADGMGGHSGGKEASAYVCRRFYDHYYARENIDLEEPADINEKLKDILKKINKEMSDSEIKKTSMFNWGTTISVLLLKNGKYYIANCGDSRIFRFTINKSELLTEDQNIAYQLYFSEGKLSYEEYLESSAQNILTSYMGMNPEELSIKTSHGDYNPKDIFLLCSDGLNQFFEKHDLENLDLDQNLSNKENLKFIEKKFTEKIDEEKSKDNITYIMVSPEEEKNEKKQSQFNPFIGFLKKISEKLKQI